jgi:DNA-binding MarR family transcriptional regulator
VLSVTEAGSRLLRDKRNARTEQLAKALSAEFTPAEVELLATAAPLLERLAESI